MSTRKHATAIQGFSRRSRRLYRKLSKRLVNRLIRSVLPFQRRGRLSTSGFILPTTVLLILIVVLTVGALTFRAFTRNTQVIGQAEQKVIYNAATPAIDRARSKLEFMFDPGKDPRLPGGVPSQDVLRGMLLNTGSNKLEAKDPTTGSIIGPDAYTLPDEQRIDINNDGTLDNAWWFRSDTNSDGVLNERDSTIVYSIVMNTPRAERQPNGDFKQIGTRLLEMNERDKANQLLVRQAPLSIDNALGCKTTSPTSKAAGPEGWFEDTRTSAVLRKNFQVDALVIPGNSNATKVTLEFNQDRQLNRGNKWGAWFRNDLEIYPGPQFNWNGAMHTEGSLIVGNKSFNAYLISSPESCLYFPDSSEVTVTKMSPDDRNPRRDYLGLVTSGIVRDGTQGGTSLFHLHHPTNPGATENIATLNAGTSSSRASNPITITLDPERTLLDPQNGYRNRQQQNNEENVNPAKRDLPDFAKDTRGNKLPARIYTKPEPMPYVDDLYRADNRWGPKGSYDQTPETRRDPNNPDEQIGDEIASSKDKLLRNEPVTGDDEAVNVGLDGYWERRARSVGLRILVGERLELGNLFTWYAPQDKNGDGLVDPRTGVVNQAQYEHEGDPLYPPNIEPLPANTLTHLDLQRRTLRDNLSAVQGTAIYHSASATNADEKDYPVACLATTSHPGTLTTLRQSITYRPFELWGTEDTTTGSLLSNFFTGVGTNGWEYDPPAGSLANFRSVISNAQSPLRRSLQNLANFAGDYNANTGIGGAYPPTQDNNIHPYPALSMWGNFSNLKRALADLDRKGYDALSVADKTYLQTASCTLGMLAHNIDQIQRFDPSNPRNDKTVIINTQRRMMAKLGWDLWRLMDGNLGTRNADGTYTEPEVLPREQLGTYLYGQAAVTAQPDYSRYNVRDYDKIPPETFIAALRQSLLNQGQLSPDSRDFIEEMRLAELIMLHHQIRRDRSFGFKPSPAFGFYDFSVSPGLGSNFFRRISTACDPDQFAFSGDDLQLRSFYAADVNRLRTPSTNTQNQPENPDNLAYLPDPASTIKRTPQLAQYRVALSRLCGTIDYALIPLQLTSVGATPGGSVPSTPPNLVGNTVPASQSIANTSFNGMSVIPVVLPKFPALYYLFPEIDHGLRGRVDTISGSLYDHRQPDRDNPHFLLSRSPLKNPDPSTSGDLTTLGAVCTVQELQTAATNPTAAASFNQACRAPVPDVILIREPYVNNQYVRDIDAQFRRVSDTRALGRASYPSLPATQLLPTPTLAPSTFPVLNGTLEGKPSRRPFSQVFPIEDYQVSQIALQPRDPNNLGASRLPYLNNPRPYNATGNERANFSTNLVLVPNNNALRTIAVPFLDRAIFDGRQLMLSRTLDIDLGMLRSTRVAQRPDIWLPLSGIVYAFREDAVREDAISRPAGAQMDLRNPRQQTDPIRRKMGDSGNPENDAAGISTKPIDAFPDPERRIHGFRLRNGVQLMRNREFEGVVMDAVRNFRGLSFFTDQPVYIQGDFNLHQNGADDTMGTRLEEFLDQLPDNRLYSATDFYGRRRPDERFSSLESSSDRGDRWRATEILADSVSILSNNFCDGTIADTFVQMRETDLWNVMSAGSFNSATPSTLTLRYPVPDFDIYSDFGAPGMSRRYYHRPLQGLFDPGCATAQLTSFHNQNRPARAMPAKTDRTQNGWDWVRENSRFDTIAPQRNRTGFAYNTGHWVDFASPVKISRTGHPIIARPRDLAAGDPAAANPPGSSPNQVLPPVPYYMPSSSTNPAVAYFNYGDSGPGVNYANQDRRLMAATATRVNSIILSGINPSRPNQGYGGLHNFPRFLERWGGQNLNFAGSLLQLSYTNYATAPFEQENLEPGATAPNPANENIDYYQPPNRLWGYDVGLQFSPAGPAAARFVTAGKSRNEFYVEPPADDPYISNLCKAAVRTIGLKANCPERN